MTLRFLPFWVLKTLLLHIFHSYHVKCQYYFEMWVTYPGAAGHCPLMTVTRYLTPCWLPVWPMTRSQQLIPFLRQVRQSPPLARTLTLHSDNILVTNASQNTTSLRCIVLILLPTGGLGCQSWGSQALRLHTKQWCRRKSVPQCYRANKEEENNKGVFLYGIAKIISIKMY